MEVINASEILFTPDDIAIWATFLNSPTGKRLIPKISDLTPRLLSRGDTNELMINHGAVLGFSAAVQVMLDLSVAKKEETPPADFWPALPPEN